MKGLTLNQREQARLEVLNRVWQRWVRLGEAAHTLGVSERHAWRLLAAYREEGAAALAHGNRGPLPANATPQEVRDQVIMLARTLYVGLNHTHLTEVLAEREGIGLARTTVRTLLMGTGIPSPRRRRLPRHRQLRERKAPEGILLQLDGSPHDWLTGRGPMLTLLLALDDATGTIAAARFRDQENTQGYLILLQDIIRCHGIPLAVYTDRHAVFQHHRTPWEKEHQVPIGKGIPTQVAKDNTVLYQQSTWQLFPAADRPSYAGASVEIQERLDRRLVVSYQGKTIASRTAPPHARLLRGHGVAGLQHGPPVPLDGSIELQGEARLAWHSERIKAGIDRARQRGQHIGRPRVVDAYWSRPDFIIAQECIRSGQLPPGRAAKEPGIGYNTLKRLLATKENPEPLTKSLDSLP